MIRVTRFAKAVGHWRTTRTIQTFDDMDAALAYARATPARWTAAVQVRRAGSWVPAQP